MNNQHSRPDAPRLSWFLVHCKANAAILARQNLQNQDFGVFLPLQKVTRRKAKQFHTSLHPLFPGYLFVQIEPLAGHWRKINSTRGVARLVQLGTDPCPVPDKVIKALLERCDADHVLQDRGALDVGHHAHISEGPLSGFVAEILAIEPDSRVHLLLDIMGQATHITVAPSMIIPAR